ncbi:MAG: hypothetical protein IAE78_29555 [Myxococcus sp.]|nr:hypothetical protein [Myxococcus sp.]
MQREALRHRHAAASRRSGSESEEAPTGEAALETLPSSAPGVTTTARYEFSYPSIEASAALALAERADAVHDRVSALLGVDAGAPIFVDLSGSMRNTVGTAYLERIRMRADEEAEATLAHETAHVLARRLIGEEGFTRWANARVLDEGLASWVEGHFTEHPAEEQLVLAALLDRRELQLADIIDFDAFRRNGDDDLKYPIGRGFIAAMVKRYGEGSIQRLLRAFADEQLPPKLSGAALWQATFQLAGMDLGLVADDFFGEVEATRAAQRSVLDALPRPQTRLVTQDGWYGVEVSAEPREAYWRLSMRFRPGPESGLDEYDRSWVRSGDVTWREARFIQRQRLCFQAGLQFTRRTTLFEPWTCVPLSAAAPYEPPPPRPDQPESFVFDGGGEVMGARDGGAVDEAEPTP